jgi:hypothetical protein
MTSPIRVGGFVFTPSALFGCSGALSGITRRLCGFGGCFIRLLGFCFPVATIVAHFFVVNFTKTTVRFASIALQTQQLDV